MALTVSLIPRSAASAPARPRHRRVSLLSATVTSRLQPIVSCDNSLHGPPTAGDGRCQPPSAAGGIDLLPAYPAEIGPVDRAGRVDASSQ